jgi:hypothetical protein
MNLAYPAPSEERIKGDIDEETSEIAHRTSFLALSRSAV